MVLLTEVPAFGATRVYLPSSGAAEVTVAYDTNWDLTAGADSVRCVTKKIYSAVVDTKTATDQTAANRSVLNRQYVSDPIAPQTLNGTVQGLIRGYEGQTNDNMVSAISIRVVSNRGTTVRGTLLNITYEANTGTPPEYGTALASRYTPISTTLNVVTSESGDRIVIEIGAYAYSNTSDVWHSFGDSSAADLTALNEATANNPWVEFSRDIQFPSVAVTD